MKTIESLINASKKVYVHMSSDEVCRRFFAQAEREGFLFGGEKPTKKEPSDIIAVLPDKTICYVGTIGRIAAGSGAENVVVVEAEKLSAESFEPYKGKIRKSGTGGIYELNDHLFEGRYSPTNAYGKREVHTVYAKTREECEHLLGEMIPKVRAEIKAEKERLKAEQNSLT